MSQQQTIGRYQVLETIASGGQGAVYRVFDPETNRVVALKVLLPHLTQNEAYVERFRREASIASSIDHPNIVPIFEIGQDGTQYFMSLEFLPESLSRIIEVGGYLRIDTAVEFGLQIATGLQAAHDRGIIHRDMKPQNVLIGADGLAKITDFGIARAEQLGTMTATGAVLGTPYYMSPEQSRGDQLDARSDLYSLGCMLYQMLTGNLPFEGDTPLSVIRQQIEDDAPRVRDVRKEIPRRLEAVVRKAMEKDPRRRFQTSTEFATALQAAVPGTRSQAGANVSASATPGSSQSSVQPSLTPSETMLEKFARAWDKTNRRRWTWVGTFLSLLLTATVAAFRLGLWEETREFAWSNFPDAASVASNYIGFDPPATEMIFSAVEGLALPVISGEGMGESMAEGSIINNPQLEMMIAESLGYTDPGTVLLSSNEILILTGLNLCNKELTDISGIGQLINLKELILCSNLITDISEVEGLINLSILDLSENRIVQIDSLVRNLGLSLGDTVVLDGNPLSESSHDLARSLRMRGVNLILDDGYGRLDDLERHPLHGNDLVNSFPVVPLPPLPHAGVSSAFIDPNDNVDVIITSPDDEIEVRITPSSVGERVNIRYRDVSNNSVAQRSEAFPGMQVERAFHVEVEGSAEKYVFYKPVLISVRFASEMADSVGWDVNNIRLLHFDNVRDGWRDITTDVNLGELRIEGQTREFSPFALVTLPKIGSLPVNQSAQQETDDNLSSLSGRVLYRGDPFPEVPVTLFRKTPGGMVAVESDSSNYDGMYHFEKLIGGTYWVGMEGLLAAEELESGVLSRITLHGDFGEELELWGNNIFTADLILVKQIRANHPINGELIGSDHVEFEWNELAGAEYYEIRVFSVGEEFPVIRDVTSNIHWSPTYSFDDLPGEYRWIINAIDDNGHAIGKTVSDEMQFAVEFRVEPEDERGGEFADPHVATTLDIISDGVHEVGVTVDGVHYGTAVVGESGPFDIGTGEMTYSYSWSAPSFEAPDGAGTGYLYGKGDLWFANLRPMEQNRCDSDYVGYRGVDIFETASRQLHKLHFERLEAYHDNNGVANSFKFGTRPSDCYEGAIVYKQNEMYGALDPVYMYENGDLVIRWWRGELGVESFDGAPEGYVLSAPLRSVIDDMRLNDAGSIQCHGSQIDFCDEEVSSVMRVEFLSESDFAGSSWRDMGGIQLFTGLQSLAIHGGQDNNDLEGFVRALKTSYKLEHLDLSSRGIDHIGPLEEMPMLKSLTLNDSQISDITPMVKQPKLEYVNLHNNYIADISPLFKLPNLREVILVGNPLDARSIREYIPALEARGVFVKY